MSTPKEEDILREQALEQIIEQLKEEFASKGQPLPSKAALRILAKKRHDGQTLLT